MNNANNLHEHQAHIVLLGRRGVGKSQLIARGVSGLYTVDAKPTRAYQQTIKQLAIGKRSVQLMIYDTPGQILTTQTVVFQTIIILLHKQLLLSLMQRVKTG